MGEPTELITNDQPWEGGVVEGAYILRRAHRFYMFYAGNACCGHECKYAEGVARASHLLGPWEKSPTNPLIHGNDKWRCPGHGTAVHGFAAHGQRGQDYFLYHAYPSTGTVYVGREAVLDRIDWEEDGWPSINGGQGPHGGHAAPALPNPSGLPAALDVPSEPNVSQAPAAPPAPAAPDIDFSDDFTNPALGASWQWPVNTYPTFATGLLQKGEGALLLRVPQGRQSAMVAVPIPGVPRHRATVLLQSTLPLNARFPADQGQPATPLYNQPPQSLWAGLSLVGDPFNTIGLGLRDGVLQLWRRQGYDQQVSWSKELARGTDPIGLRVLYSEGARLHFFFRIGKQEAGTHQAGAHQAGAQQPGAHENEAHEWTPAGEPVDGSQLPAWDRGLRIGLMLEGPGHSAAAFQHFTLQAGN